MAGSETVDPRTIKNVTVNIGEDTINAEPLMVNHLELGIVEIAETLTRDTGLLLPKGLVSVKEGRTTIQIMNVHDQPIRLAAGQMVGLLYPVDSVQKVECISTQSSQEILSGENRLVTEKDIPEYIRLVLEELTSELTAQQLSDACQVILDFPERFLTPGGKTGRSSWTEHEMDMQGNPPTKAGYHRLPLAKQNIVDTEVEKMLKDDIIEPSHSPWASPVVLVKKKDGSIRFCVDFRKVNERSRKDSYPLPRIDETLDTLGGASWFCTMDLASGYWQIKMRESDRPKTAFVTRKGLFQFKVMPFGLCNAPATFQRLMKRVLMGLQWEQCLVYLDDIIVFGATFEETLKRLRTVMECLEAAGLKLKPSKCKWFQRSVHYLGHVVSGEGIKCDPEKISQVVKWPMPTTITQIRGFLGLASYYRKFIPSFSELAGPLTNLTRKDVPFEWTDHCQDAFEALKSKLTTAPVLSYPMPEEGSFILDTDASNQSIGAVLSQEQEGEERVSAYASHTLNCAEKNYCTTKKEFLAVVYFVEHFRHYLYGRRFIIRTDHASLKWLKNFKNIDGMLARWLAKLDTYDYEFIHRKGEAHSNADALSRLPARKCPRADCPHCTFSINAVHLQPDGSENVQWLEEWTQDEVRQWQREDPSIGQVIRWLEKSPDMPDKEIVQGMSAEVKAFCGQWEVLQLREGILYRKWYPFGSRHRRGQAKWQLVAPNEIRRRILISLHNSPTGCHFGSSKTVNKVRYRFYWPGYKQDVTSWCASCDICAQSKPGPRRRKAKLGQVPVGAPLERVAVDIMGPLPKTDSGNEYIMVLTDYFTKWTEAYPLANHTAQTVADVMMEQFVSRFGIPQKIRSDQGREFESKLIFELCKLLRIKKTRTTPYNPKSDGLVERFNRTMKQMLTTLVADAKSDWDNHLPYVMMAYRSSVQESTKCTPNLLMLNREVTMPLDLIVGNPNDGDQPICPVEYVEWVRLATEQAYEFVRKNLKLSARRQKLYYDREGGNPEFHPGKFVWRYYPPMARQKFGKSRQGPFLVTRKISPLVYEIQKSPHNLPLAVSVDHLKKYQGPLPVQNWLGDEVGSDEEEADEGENNYGEEPHIEVEAGELSLTHGERTVPEPEEPLEGEDLELDKFFAQSHTEPRKRTNPSAGSTLTSKLTPSQDQSTNPPRRSTRPRKPKVIFDL